MMEKAIASLSVEVDFGKPFASKIFIDKHLLNVEYENISTICFSCGRIGHRQEGCTSKQSKSNGVNTNHQSDCHNPEPTRTWLLVQRRQIKKGCVNTERGNMARPVNAVVAQARPININVAAKAVQLATTISTPAQKNHDGCTRTQPKTHHDIGYLFSQVKLIQMN